MKTLYRIKSRWGYFRADAKPYAPRWTRDPAKAYAAGWDDTVATQFTINVSGDGNTRVERVQ